MNVLYAIICPLTINIPLGIVLGLISGFFAYRMRVQSGEGSISSKIQGVLTAICPIVIIYDICVVMVRNGRRS